MHAEDFITASTGLSDVPDVFRRMLVRSATGTLDIKTAILPEVMQ
jgi:L-iditol 2-dehydrogenase